MATITVTTNLIQRSNENEDIKEINGVEFNLIVDHILSLTDANNLTEGDEGTVIFLTHPIFNSTDRI